MEDCDPNLKINCLETSFHILYTCQYLSNLRSQIFLKHTINENELFSDDIQLSITKILKFTSKAKILDKIPQIRKRDISPNRII